MEKEGIVSGEMFFCPNCGPAEDPLAKTNGCCPGCGAELVRVAPPPMEPPEPDGITRHFAEEEKK